MSLASCQVQVGMSLMIILGSMLGLTIIIDPILGHETSFFFIYVTFNIKC